jgi:hypothetical protein
LQEIFRKKAQSRESSQTSSLPGFERNEIVFEVYVTFRVADWSPAVEIALYIKEILL